MSECSPRAPPAGRYRWRCSRAAYSSAEAIFFIAFACWFTLLLIPSIMLPRIYTVTIAIVVASLVLAIVGELHGAPTLLKIAGAGFLTVSFFIAWLWINANTAAAGMKAWPPLGAPVASSFTRANHTTER